MELSDVLLIVVLVAAMSADWVAGGGIGAAQVGGGGEGAA